MAEHPLTHHEILTLVAPFSRRGRHVDLGASDRARRRLAFRPVAHGELEERLYLDASRSGRFQVKRVLSGEGRPEAHHQVEGEDREAALEKVLALEPSSQYRPVAGSIIADSYQAKAEPKARPALVQCEAVVRGLRLRLDARSVLGEPFGLRLDPAAPGSWKLPEDLLSLLGRRYRALRESSGGWKTSIRAPGSEPARTRAGLERSAALVDHLDAVLAEPPQAYHRRFGPRRWRIYVRRLEPLILSALVVAALPVIDIVLLEDREMHPLFLNLPPVLLVGAMALLTRDSPGFWMPSLPRPLAADAWPEGRPERTGAAHAGRRRAGAG